MKTKKIIDKLEKFAPLCLQEDWDNSGWQIFLENDECKKILLTTTITEKTVSFAVENFCDLIISHHPLIFNPLKKINNKIISNAIKNNIQIYSMHTNFDKTKGGTSEILASFLGFKKINKINDFVVETDCEKPINIDDFIKFVKEKLNIKKIKVINYDKNKKFKKICFCAGSGGDFIENVVENGGDLYITSDLKYHQYQEIPQNFCIFDIGHLESEKISLNKIKDILSKENVEIFVEKENTNVSYL